MMRPTKTAHLPALALFAVLTGCMPPRTELAPAPIAQSCPAPLQPYLRTILYTADFSGPAWDQFLTDVIGQHFPAGGSITSGPGWWRRPDGTTARGNGKQINVLVPATQTEAQRTAVRTVIASIKQRFNQMSVGWEESLVCAGF